MILLILKSHFIYLLNQNLFQLAKIKLSKRALTIFLIVSRSCRNICTRIIKLATILFNRKRIYSNVYSENREYQKCKKCLNYTRNRTFGHRLAIRAKTTVDRLTRHIMRRFGDLHKAGSCC